MCVCVYLNHFAVHQKLTQHCKSATIFKKWCWESWTDSEPPGKPLVTLGGAHNSLLMRMGWVVTCRVFCHCHQQGGWRSNTSKHKDPRGWILRLILKPNACSTLSFQAVSRSLNLTPFFLAACAVVGVSGIVCERLSPGNREQGLSVDPQSDPFVWHDSIDRYDFWCRACK